MKAIADQSREKIRRVHLIGPFFSLLAFLSGALAAYVNQNHVFLLFFVPAALFTVFFLVYLVVKLRRQRPSGPASPEEL